MARLFAEIEDEKGITLHKVANKTLCANFYYGSRQHSIRGLTVCEIVDPKTETVLVSAQFISPQGKIIHLHEEKQGLPREIPTVPKVVTPTIRV